ncbi:MAG: histidine phosphatase family protein [Clostridia bacterium]|nr:histidine phosphatase family protein [Clostridia bacterium]
MKWILIRHGKTQGNLEHRYIGCRTDEPLCAQGIAELKGKDFPAVQRVYTSPMKRCLETAGLLYPSIPVEIVEDFRECDFGDFENLNYSELNGRPDYQAWIESNGETPFPNGESRAGFSARCSKAFDAIRDQSVDCAVIAHGGTIMAIMEKNAVPAGSYYDFQVGNADGFVLEMDGTYHLLAEKR